MRSLIKVSPYAITRLQYWSIRTAVSYKMAYALTRYFFKIQTLCYCSSCTDLFFSFIRLRIYTYKPIYKNSCDILQIILYICRLFDLLYYKCSSRNWWTRTTS